MKKRKIIHVIGHVDHGTTCAVESLIIARDIHGRGVTISNPKKLEKNINFLNKENLIKESVTEFKHTSKYHK